MSQSSQSSSAGRLTLFPAFALAFPVRPTKGAERALIPLPHHGSWVRFDDSIRLETRDSRPPNLRGGRQ